MNNINAFTECANCGACYNVCPKDAIRVNVEGLFYSVAVEEDKCVDCGLCQAVCPVNTKKEAQKTVGAYALVHNSDEIVKKSSSGGAFSALAEQVLARGGVVFGAAYDDDFRTVKICSTQTVLIDELRRSKYVESLVGNSFREVKLLLDAEKPVLYCGAPCQIAGLKRYLQRDYEQLLTCDFSCGGMPSHELYTQWLDGIRKNLGADICEVNFRPKTYGWSSYAVKIRAKNNKEYSKLALEDGYFKCFIGNHISVRDYCLHCNFANNHYADIVLADFWKHKSISNIRNENKGISLVISNSAKGDAAILGLARQCALTVLDLEQASYNLVPKSRSGAFIEQRKAFLEKCQEVGFATATRGMNLRGGVAFRVKYAIKKLLGRY